VELAVENLSVRYGGVRALDDVSINAASGEFVCILGANGAGKSSLLNAIVGLVRHQGGSVLVQGERIDQLPAHRIARKGVTLVPEGRMVFAKMSVRENLLLAARLQEANRGSHPPRSLESILDRFPILRERLDAPAGLLSGGQQQMLVLGRALMSGARIILLDEPSLGLAPLIIKEVFDLLGRVRGEEGLTIILVEQNARQALAVADRGYVLRNGRVVAAGAAAELKASGAAEEAYLGRSSRNVASENAES
jgi:ABC-type branched-subunit amino acid transport system ATPase component